jgi:hypothetical protein
MKNEYLMLVLIRTLISKHYLAMIYYKDGIKLPSLKLDIKGKNLKASDISINILNHIVEFSNMILSDIKNYKSLNVDIILEKIIYTEKKIYDSIKNRDYEYLFSVPIEDKSKYKNYMSSVYFLYMVWEEVFSNKYGKITIPQRCVKLALKKPLTIKRISNIEYIKAIDKNIYNNLIQFLQKYPNKKINNLIMPKIKIPEELIPLLDIQKIIRENCFGLYLIAMSLGISIIDSKKSKLLLGEIYKQYNYDL